MPHKITIGDFLKICRQPGFDPAKTAFMMCTAQGPCRFGQYAPYLRKLLDEQGLSDVMVFSPSSGDGYEGYGLPAGALAHTMWLAVLAGDLTLRFLLKTRPYEQTAGDSDEAFHRTIRDFEEVLEHGQPKPKQRRAAMASAVERMRDRFRSIPARYTKDRPLIGLVGEIFCRLNTFSNDDIARRVEKFGGECWISDVGEWVWYVNAYVKSKIVREPGWFKPALLQHKIKTTIQRNHEHALLAPVAQDLVGYEEPHDIREVLEAAEPYLPQRGCIGEMILNTGKTIYLHGKGADGIIDISPFTCMNGVVCEGIYPAISESHDGLPIRTCYFDGANTNIDRDLEIFLDLARAYQKRKKIPRIYPDYFDNATLEKPTHA